MTVTPVSPSEAWPIEMPSMESRQPAPMSMLAPSAALLAWCRMSVGLIAKISEFIVDHGTFHHSSWQLTSVDYCIFSGFCSDSLLTHELVQQ